MKQRTDLQTLEATKEQELIESTQKVATTLQEHAPHGFCVAPDLNAFVQAKTLQKPIDFVQSSCQQKLKNIIQDHKNHYSGQLQYTSEVLKTELR